MANIDLTESNWLSPLVNNLNILIHNVPAALIALLVGLLIIRILSWISHAIIRRTHLTKSVKEIISFVIDGLLAVFLLIVVLQTLGLSNLALVFSAFVAAAGVALGSGGTALIGDMVGGINLSHDRDFGMGDIVQVGEDKVEGEVVGMSMRRTRIKDANGHIHSFPNTAIERKEYVLLTKKRDRTDS
jgi:small-conductance mechanosensitive channel